MSRAIEILSFQNFYNVLKTCSAGRKNFFDTLSGAADRGSAFPCLQQLSALIGPIQGCDNLRPGAGGVGAEAAVLSAVGHTVFHGPRHRGGVVAVRRNIVERGGAIAVRVQRAAAKRTVTLIRRIGAPF